MVFHVCWRSPCRRSSQGKAEGRAESGGIAELIIINKSNHWGCIALKWPADLLPGSIRTRRRYSNIKARNTLRREMDLILTLATERPRYNILIMEISRRVSLSANNKLHPVSTLQYNDLLINYIVWRTKLQFCTLSTLIIESHLVLKH